MASRSTQVLKGMEADGKGEHFEEQAEGSGHVTWNPAMSSFMLSYLSNVVAGGTRTSSGFKKVHLNMCARAVNDHFKTKITRENVKNHLKTWQRKYAKINKLRRLSATGWDEDNFIITLDHEHYADYVKDHKTDAQYLNKPLEHYGKMVTIFANSMATGKYAKGSSEPLGTEDGQAENEEEDVNAIPTTPEDNGASSSTTRPNKRAKIAENEVEGLIGAFKAASERLAVAIERAGTAGNELPSDLFENVTSLPGFNDTHKSFYYAHLVEKPHIARAFNSLPFDYKLTWLAKFVSDHFPGC